MAKAVKCPICAGSFEVAEVPPNRLVRCPTCGTEFSPNWAEASETSTPASIDPQVRERARAALRPTGFALLSVGILGAASNLLRMTLPFVPAEYLQSLPPILAQPTHPASEVLYGSSFLVVNGIIILGARQMLRLKTYWLAMTVCWLATINFSNLCCLLSYPIGAWSFFVLRRPEVKSAFE